jgi:hypothetical protein
MANKHRFTTEQERGNAAFLADSDVKDLRLKGKRARKIYSSDSHGPFYIAEEF